jgi:hypothetical protein
MLLAKINWTNRVLYVVSQYPRLYPGMMDSKYLEQKKCEAITDFALRSVLIYNLLVIQFRESSINRVITSGNERGFIWTKI